MAFQLKSGHKLVDFFKNTGNKIKAAGVKHQTWKDSRAKASADANAAGGGFKKFQADAAEMRKTGKSKYQLDQVDAAAKRKIKRQNPNATKHAFAKTNTLVEKKGPIYDDFKPANKKVSRIIPKDFKDNLKA
jgi:hypothetical protein